MEGSLEEIRGMLENILEEVREIRKDNNRILSELLKPQNTAIQEQETENLMSVGMGGCGEGEEWPKKHIKMFDSVEGITFSMGKDLNFAGGQGRGLYPGAQHDGLWFYTLREEKPVLPQFPGDIPEMGGTCSPSLRKDLLNNFGNCRRGAKKEIEMGSWEGRKAKIKIILLLWKITCPDPGGGLRGNERGSVILHRWEGG